MSRLILPPRFSRRHFLIRAARATGVALSSGLLIGCGDDEEGGPEATPDSGTVDAGGMADSGSGPDAASVIDTGVDTAAAVSSFRFAVVADTHVIDEFYTGQESNELDTTSLQFSAERYRAARDFIMSLEPGVDFVIHLGDFLHDYPNGSLDFMVNNQTRMDIAQEITSGFGVPFHLCFGNHDYEFGDIPRTETHAFYQERLGVPPYEAFEHNGWKFIVMNCYTGETRNPASSSFGSGNSSLGEEQLMWVEAELADGKPTFMFVHESLSLISRDENGRSLHDLLVAHQDHIKYVLSGHTHRWLKLGNQFGPEHMVIGATRYDEDCFVIVEVDVENEEFTFLNEAGWQYLSVYADPWQDA